jgi:integral membrane sensor domain MASE1
LRERTGDFAAFVILCVFGASWLPTYLAGGASTMPPLWFFVPILLAGVRFGTAGAALAAVAATVLAGPLTPGDVAHHIAQQQSDWLIRGGFFLA